MTMMRWEPFREMMALRNAMDRLFEEGLASPSRFWPDAGEGEAPLLDVYETDEALVIKASLPGVKAEDVDISITGEVLTVKGERKEEKESQEGKYIRRERRYGTFNRSLALPLPVQTDKAEAEFEHGVLKLTLPKAETIKPKQIQIKPKVIVEGKK